MQPELSWLFQVPIGLPCLSLYPVFVAKDVAAMALCVRAGGLADL